MQIIRGRFFEAGGYCDRDGSGADIRRLSLAEDGVCTGRILSAGCIIVRRRDGTHEQPGDGGVCNGGIARQSPK